MQHSYSIAAEEQGPFLEHQVMDNTTVKVVTQDEIDARKFGSNWTLFMPKTYRYYFQHPYLRLTVAYLVILLNFFIYAEDPITHSVIECNIPFLGNIISLIFSKYPPHAWSVAKVFAVIIGFIFGIWLGHIIHTDVFNQTLHLRMFSNHQGTWMTKFISCLVVLYIVSHIYTGLLIGAGVYTLPYRVDHYIGITNAQFTKIAAICTWLGDIFTAWMVTDLMLQDILYPHWIPAVRIWWRTGYNRVWLFWVVGVLMTIFVTIIIAVDVLNWDSINGNKIHSDEMSRAFLASFILVLDFTIVMQDWAFPHFETDIHIKLPGINHHKIHFKILDTLEVHITGKWLNYGILFIVMLLDLNMWKNQILYKPQDFGQFTGPDNRIYTPRDTFTLSNFGNTTYFTFAWRNTTINPLNNLTYISTDHRTNSKYKYTRLAYKAIAFIPSLFVGLIFVILIFWFGRDKPTSAHPFGNRLQKKLKCSSDTVTTNRTCLGDTTELSAFSPGVDVPYCDKDNIASENDADDSRRAVDTSCYDNTEEASGAIKYNNKKRASKLSTSKTAKNSKRKRFNFRNFKRSSATVAANRTRPGDTSKLSGFSPGIDVPYCDKDDDASENDADDGRIAVDASCYDNIEEANGATKDAGQKKGSKLSTSKMPESKKKVVKHILRHAAKKPKRSPNIKKYKKQTDSSKVKKELPTSRQDMKEKQT